MSHDRGKAIGLTQIDMNEGCDLPGGTLFAVKRGMLAIFKKPKTFMAYNVFFAAFCFGFSATACLPALRGLQSEAYRQSGGQMDLCQLADRYAAAKSRLARQGVDALQIADVRAPRFIQVDHWEARKRQRVPFRNNYDPRTMYDRPGQEQGSVWEAWNRAALEIDRSAAGYHDQITEGRFQGLDLSVEMILALHRQAMGNIESQVITQIRTGPVIGQAMTRASAPSLSEIQNLNRSWSSRRDSGEQPPRESLVRWVSTACFEELSAETQAEISRSGRRIRNDLYPQQEKPFADSRGVQRQCGYFVYSPPEEVASQLASLHEDVNAKIGRLLSGSEGAKAELDPIFIAAKAQRWFVAIHPFIGGNGRTSRLLMDLILQSLGLPVPQISDVNRDLTTDNEAWAVEIAKGIEKTIQILENCSENPFIPQCQRVPWSDL